MMNQVNRSFTDWCEKRDLAVKTLHETDASKTYLVSGDDKFLEKYIAKLAREHDINSHVEEMGEEHLVVLSEDNIAEESLDRLRMLCEQSHNELYMKLDNILCEDMAQYKFPSEIHTRRSRATHSFPHGFRHSQDDQDFSTLHDPLNKPKKNLDKKIEEALDGIASPMNLQPEEGLKSLSNALKATGLDKALKKAGVSWHVAQPGKHTISFLVGKVPVLKKDTISLADDGELAVAISELESIARGEAPEAGQMEADRAKKRESDARDIATQFAVGNKKQPDVTVR